MNGKEKEAMQKPNLNYTESAEKQYDLLCAKIREKCPKGCKCELHKWNHCKIYQEFLIADWMRGVAHGNSVDWEMVFRWALDGILQMKGLVNYRPPKGWTACKTTLGVGLHALGSLT